MRAGSRCHPRWRPARCSSSARPTPRRDPAPGSASAGPGSGVHFAGAGGRGLRRVLCGGDAGGHGGNRSAIGLGRSCGSRGGRGRRSGDPAAAGSVAAAAGSTATVAAGAEAGSGRSGRNSPRRFGNSTTGGGGGGGGERSHRGTRCIRRLGGLPARAAAGLWRGLCDGIAAGSDSWRSRRPAATPAGVAASADACDARCLAPARAGRADPARSPRQRGRPVREAAASTLAGAGAAGDAEERGGASAVPSRAASGSASADAPATPAAAAGATCAQAPGCGRPAQPRTGAGSRVGGSRRRKAKACCRMAGGAGPAGRRLYQPSDWTASRVTKSIAPWTS